MVRYHPDGKRCPAKIRCRILDEAGHIEADSKAEFEVKLAERMAAQDGGLVGSSFIRERDPKRDGFSAESFYGDVPPREVQLEALNATADALIEDGKTQLIAACGTGKSFMGRQLMRRMMEEEDANGVAIVLTSSVKLAQDTASDLKPEGGYDGALGEHGKDYEAVEVIEIHHESDSLKDGGALSIGKIAEKWGKALDKGKRVVVVSTYQSSDKVRQVQELLGERSEADLLMNDEAHNILGRKKMPRKGAKLSDEEDDGENENNAGYRSFHNEIPGAIQSKRRLYATATPVAFEGGTDAPPTLAGEDTEAEALKKLKAKAAEMDRDPRVRMAIYANDESIMGRVSGSITKDQAVGAQALVPMTYEIRAARVEKGLTADSFVDARGGRLQGEVDPEGKKPMTAQTYAAVVGTLNQMAADPEEGKNPSHNGLVFFRRIDQTEAFRDNFREVATELSGGISRAEALAAKDSPNLELRTRARMRLLADDATVKAAHSGMGEKEKEAAFTMFQGKDLREETTAGGWSPHKNVLANVNIFSEGVSLNEIDTVVIADTARTSEKALTQGVGRASRVVNGNGFKSTGYTVIPQVVDSAGRELNGGLVSKATYGITRFERGVTVKNLRGEDVPEDNKTEFSIHGADGSVVRQKANEIIHSHGGSPRAFVASQTVAIAQRSLKQKRTAKDGEFTAEWKDSYHAAATPAEQQEVLRSYIHARSKMPENRNGGPQWEIANGYLQSPAGRDMESLRHSGAVSSQAATSGDHGALHGEVARAMSRTGILKAAKSGSGGSITSDEKRKFLRENSEAVAMALSSGGASKSANGTVKQLSHLIAGDPDSRTAEQRQNNIAANKVLMGAATMGADQGRGSVEISRRTKLFESYLDSDANVDSFYEAIQSERSSSLNQFETTAKRDKTGRYSGLFQKLREMGDLDTSRRAEAASQGSAGLTLEEGAFTSDGSMSSKHLSKLAEDISNG